MEINYILLLELVTTLTITKKVTLFLFIYLYLQIIKAAEEADHIIKVFMDQYKSDQNPNIIYHYGNSAGEKYINNQLHNAAEFITSLCNHEILITHTAHSRCSKVTVSLQCKIEMLHCNIVAMLQPRSVLYG